MVTYRNYRGEGNNGHCCDGRGIFCFGECDHVFTVCLDDKTGYVEYSSGTAPE